MAEEQAKSNAGAVLKSIVKRVENLAEQRAKLQADISEILKEAKSNGHNVKAIRRVLALRKQTAAERDSFQYEVDVMLHSLGMIQ